MNSKILLQLKDKLVYDQIGKPVLLPKPPIRIISLVPSITELLYDLGLDDKVIAITKFCIAPNIWFTTKEKIGGTKTLHIKKIFALQPDLIIANKEENVKEQIELLGTKIPVYTSEVNNLNSALQMIADIGKLTVTAKKANLICQKINNNFSKLKLPTPNKRVVYLIWKDPYITIGGDTFINAMLQLMGCTNIFATTKRYPTIDLSILQKKKIDCIFLSSEPFPFKEKHIATIQNILPKVKIILVDGAMFSWYGSRLIQAPKYFKKLQKEILIS